VFLLLQGAIRVKIQNYLGKIRHYARCQQRLGSSKGACVGVVKSARTTHGTV
jgi:hypothetical protein